MSTCSKSSHLLGIGPRVHVHQHGVPPVLVKVVGEVQPDLGIVAGELALDLNVLRERGNGGVSEHLNFILWTYQIGDLWQVLVREGGGESGVGHKGGNLAVGGLKKGRGKSLYFCRNNCENRVDCNIFKTKSRVK